MEHITVEQWEDIGLFGGTMVVALIFGAAVLWERFRGKR
jgi:hypothetical protein